MRLALPAPPEMLPWLAERAQLRVSPELRGIAAIGDDGKIAGMVGFDGWLPNACYMHVAFDDPRAIFTVLRPAFGMAFDWLGLGLVLAWVLGTNERSLKLVKGLGFREVARVKDGWKPGVDLVLHEMRRDECRWTKRRAA